MFRSAMVASPASNGGRGLKPLLQHQRQRPKRASPASNGGRGLKLAGRHCVHQKLQGIARQQWRARIETDWMREAQAAFNGIARQQWRARIETAVVKLTVLAVMGHRPPAMAGAD